MTALDKYYESIETHRRLVWQVGRVLGVDTAQLAIHDLSKYDLIEFNTYVEWFHGDRDKPNAKEKFQIAWQHHIRGNFHHWQHWVLEGAIVVRNSTYPNNAISMPHKYILEMVVDWQAAEIQNQGHQTMSKWLNINFDKMVFHKDTRKHVIQILEGMGYRYYYENGVSEFILKDTYWVAQQIEEIVIRHHKRG